jgi:hypothetical protein
LNFEKAIVNPYAPPQSSLKSAGNTCFRDGKVLVVPTGEALPERCVKCNGPATMDKPKTYSWHHPGYYLLILVGIIVYVIVGMIARKKVQLAVGLCAAHRQRRRTLNLTALGLFVFGCLGLFGGMHFDLEPLGWTAALALLASVILALVAGSLLSPARIDEHEARLRGCGAAFLESLPQR